MLACIFPVFCSKNPDKLEVSMIPEIKSGRVTNKNSENENGLIGLSTRSPSELDQSMYLCGSVWTKIPNEINKIISDPEVYKSLCNNARSFAGMWNNNNASQLLELI